MSVIISGLLGWLWPVTARLSWIVPRGLVLSLQITIPVWHLKLEWIFGLIIICAIQSFWLYHTLNNLRTKSQYVHENLRSWRSRYDEAHPLLNNDTIILPCWSVIIVGCIQKLVQIIPWWGIRENLYLVDTLTMSDFARVSMMWNPTRNLINLI